MSVDTALRSSDAPLSTLVQRALTRTSRMLTEAEGKSVLAQSGVDVPNGAEIGLDEDCPAILTGPLVVKAVSPTLVHKSDAGGVRVGVDRDELPAVRAEMARSLQEAGHELTGLLVEEMAPKGHEVIVGAVRNPEVGWVVMVGLGGVLVEVFEDVAFGVAPLRDDQIVDMLEELRGMAVLRGARGGVQADIPALVDVMAKLAGPAGLLSRLPDEVVEIDLNPIIVSESRAVAADARLLTGPAAPQAAGSTVRTTDFAPLFHPRRIAVLGASGSRRTMGNKFIRTLQENGYTGTIVPVHPHADRIEGLPAAASLGHVDEAVDYAYVALPGARVAESLGAGNGLLRFAQVISSGFGEVGGGQELEDELVRTTRRAGIRLIGPNCLGTHSSAGGLSFIPDAPMVAGSTAVISQSGGLSVDILRAGAAQGIDFHSVVSIGNAADVTAGELIQDHLDNDEVSVIGLYLESISMAADALRVLSRATVRKPVVLLAGGRTAEGSRAAASHTGALAGNHRLWPAIARQAGATLVDSLNDFAAALHALSTLDLTVPVEGRSVVLFGNGGGASVLAADALDREGRTTPLFDRGIVEALEALELPPGNGLANPIDVPAGTLAVERGAIAGDIVRTVLDRTAPATMITHLNVGIIQRNLGETLGDVTGTIIESVARARDESPAATHHMLVLKGDGSDEIGAQIDDYARRARERGIPVFDTFEDAAVAARAVGEQSTTIRRAATSDDR